jgi:hypothetical protein
MTTEMLASSGNAVGYTKTFHPNAVGIAITAIVLVVLALAAASYLRRRRRKQA